MTFVKSPFFVVTLPSGTKEERAKARCPYCGLTTEARFLHRTNTEGKPEGWYNISRCRHNYKGVPVRHPKLVAAFQFGK